MWTCTFVLSAVALILILGVGNYVDATPDPCLIWNYRHRHVEDTTPKTESPVEILQLTHSSKKNKFNKLEKLIGEWRKYRGKGDTATQKD